MAPLVVEQSNGDTAAIGDLFEGLAFFLVQRLPQRSRFAERIQSNGGRVVKLEKQADHIIADHLRADSPPGSLSYTFIDEAIRIGELPDPADHQAGAPKGSVREVGSVVPGRSTRTPFTAEEDRVLWQWVARCKAEGMPWKGNEMYKQLEERNSRHTHQSWRDRYIKYLVKKPPAGEEVTVAANAPPSPPTAQDEQQEISAGPSIAVRSPNKKRKTRESGSEFTEDDLKQLLENGDDIEIIQEDRVEEAWGHFAQTFSQHTPRAWRNFWEQTVRPVYLKRAAIKKEAAQRKLDAEDRVGANGVEGRSEEKESDEQPTAAGVSATQPAATPNRPQSSGSQKRKRGTPTPKAKATHGRKKQKADHSNIFVPDGSDNESTAEAPQLRQQSQTKLSTQAIEILSDDDDEPVAEVEPTMPTSELNRAAATQLDREDDVGAEITFQTSELNREAQAQFDEEALGIPRIDTRPNDVSMSNLPTSEVNQAVEQQILRESLEREVEDQDGQEGSPPRMPAVLSSEANGKVRSQDLGRDPVMPVDAQGDALTEANLASQQAQHKAQLLRATDLPEDDDLEDVGQQDNYVRFLQSITNQSGVSRTTW